MKWVGRATTRGRDLTFGASTGLFNNSVIQSPMKIISPNLLTVALLMTCASASAQFQLLIGQEQQTNAEYTSIGCAYGNGDVVAFVRNASDRFYARFAQDGTLLWSQEYMINGSSAYLDATIPCLDGSTYIIDGPETIYDGPSIDTMQFMIARTDEAGQVLWAKDCRYPRSTNSIGTLNTWSWSHLPSDEFQITLHDFGNGSGPDHTFRFGGDGSLLWARAQDYTNSAGSAWSATFNTADGGLLIARVSMDMFAAPMYFARLGPLGEPIWTKELQLTNTTWNPRNCSFLMTPDEELYVHGETLGMPPMAGLYPFLLKIAANGELEWYRLYGNGGLASSVGSTGAELLPNGQLRFGTLGRNTYTPDGDHVSYSFRFIPSWSVAPHSFLLGGGSSLAGDERVLIGGKLSRTDDLFGYGWTTAYLGLVDMDAAPSCGWTDVVGPVLTDTIVPPVFIDYEDGNDWLPANVSVTNTSVQVVPFVPTAVTTYCAPVGITEEAAAPMFTVFPNQALAGSTVNVVSVTSGQLSVIDQMGRQVQSMILRGGTTTTLTTTGLSSGAYNLRLEPDDGSLAHTERLVIE